MKCFQVCHLKIFLGLHLFLAGVNGLFGVLWRIGKMDRKPDVQMSCLALFICLTNRHPSPAIYGSTDIHHQPATTRPVNVRHFCAGVRKGTSRQWNLMEELFVSKLESKKKEKRKQLGQGWNLCRSTYPFDPLIWGWRRKTEGNSTFCCLSWLWHKRTGWMCLQCQRNRLIQQATLVWCFGQFQWWLSQMIYTVKRLYVRLERNILARREQYPAYLPRQTMQNFTLSLVMKGYQLEPLSWSIRINNGLFCVSCFVWPQLHFLSMESINTSQVSSCENGGGNTKLVFSLSEQ